MPFPLQTPRLILRPFAQSDLAAFVAYRSDPQTARYQSWEAPYPEEKARKFIETLLRSQPGTPGEWYQLAVVRKDSGEMIGDCAFHILAEDSSQAEIGYTLSPRQRRRGFATEAVAGLLRYLFEECRLHRVRAVCDAENPASARVLERIGMRREAFFKENIWFKGAWGSEWVYAILESEWKRLQTAPAPRFLYPAEWMLFVPDRLAAAEWYARLLSTAVQYLPEDHHYIVEAGGIRITFHLADEKMPAGKAGQTLYWQVSQFDAALGRALACGAALYRGPLERTDNLSMAQVSDPFGNLIGIIGPRPGLPADMGYSAAPNQDECE